MKRLTGLRRSPSTGLSILLILVISIQPINPPARAHASPGAEWHMETVGQGNLNSQFTTLALDPSGKPVIALLAPGSAQLHLMTRELGVWVSQTVSGIDCEPGSPPALVYGSDGYPRVACADFNGSGAFFAAWNGTAWAIERVFSGTPTTHVALGLDENDSPLLALWAKTSPYNGVWLLTSADTGWQTRLIETCSASACPAVALAMKDGCSPSVSYWREQTLRYASAPTWTPTTLYSHAQPGSGAVILRHTPDGQALALFQAGAVRLAQSDPDGTPVEEIAAGSLLAGDLRPDADGNLCALYQGETGLALSCRMAGVWQTQVVALGSWLPGSLAFDPNGDAHLSYADPISATVYYATNALVEINFPKIYLPILSR